MTPHQARRQHRQRRTREKHTHNRALQQEKTAMNVDFRQTLLSILDLPSDTTDDGILASVTALVAKSAALTRVECLAWKAESKCNDTMWTEDVLAALRGESR